jgi:homoserine kinase
MPDLRSGEVTAVTAATSANLGPGYDAFGLALGLHDVVTCEATRGGLEIEVTGEAVAEVPRDESHLVVRSIRSAFDAMGVRQPGLRLVCRNAIPHGRGLGSSAAAVVSGVTIAAALVPDAIWHKTDTLRLAAEIEGHPDNVAACIYGGFTIAWGSGDTVEATRLDAHERISACAFVPSQAVSTHTARRLLPDHVPHHDAAFNVGRAALMVAAITQHPELLFAATEDRLHQGYRQPAMPATIELVDRLRAIGIPAFVSGAGPSVLALVAESKQAVAVGDGWRQLDLDIDVGGAQTVFEEPR